MGEIALAYRLQDESDKLGWQSYIFFYSRTLQNIPLLNWPFYSINFLLNYFVPIEFNFVVTNLAAILPPHPRYLFINITPEEIVNYNNKFIDIVDEYDGYVDINQLSPVITNPNWINDALKQNGKAEVPVIGFVVPVARNIYLPSTPNRLIIFGGVGGAPRGTARYLKFFSLLAKNGHTLFYGTSNIAKFAGDSYKGLLADDGKDLLTTINQAGIGLAIHAQSHLSAAIPTTRIFEIVSSGAVAISDENEFVRKVFGDNVLYFDQSKGAEIMAAQVEQHIKWIITHPKQAEQMASKAHQIFLEHYTADKLLLSLKSMDDKLKHR